MTRMPDIKSFEEWKRKPHAFHISSYRRDIIEKLGGFKESLKTCEDINFYYKIFENNLKFKHIKKKLYNWRINPKGITQTTNMKCVECKHGEECTFYNNFKELNLIK